MKTKTNWKLVNRLALKARYINRKEHFKLAQKAMVEVAKVRKSWHCSYNINYHLVWIPKTRMKVLTAPFKEVVEITVKRVCAYNDWKLLALQVMPDHVHCFVSAKPYIAPQKIVSALKTWSSKDLRKKYATIRKTRIIVDNDTGKEIDMKDFWARGYYCGTAGHVSAQVVANYILIRM